MGSFESNKINERETGYSFSDIMNTIDQEGFIAEKTYGSDEFILSAKGYQVLLKKQHFVDKVYQALHQKYPFTEALAASIDFFIKKAIQDNYYQD